MTDSDISVEKFPRLTLMLATDPDAGVEEASLLARRHTQTRHHVGDGRHDVGVDEGGVRGRVSVAALLRELQRRRRVVVTARCTQHGISSSHSHPPQSQVSINSKLLQNDQSLWIEPVELTPFVVAT